MVRATVAASFLILTSSGLSGQPAPARSFEVASVKPHGGPLYRMDISTSGPRLNTEGANLLQLIMYAYNLKNYQVSGTTSPLFTTDARYEIAAKAEGDGVPTKDEFRQMLQSLLADRFQLTVHRETREMPVYALLVDKNGPKFKESAPDASPMGHFHWTGRDNEITIPKASMDALIGAIANSMLDRPVIDKTGLTGTYDIKLKYTPDLRSNREAGPDPNDITVFTAVREQLGLRLEPQKAVVEVLMVDHVEKPSGN
jgi:uncharacterized protein (TIGR03435 family)